MSHMINGRTYRDILTTNNLPEPEKAKPQKLNQITTAIIPDGPQDEPEPIGDGFAKMITTHDDFPVDLGVDNHAEEDEDAPAPEPKTKRKPAGRPKKV